MILGVDPKVDYVFKKLFATEPNALVLLSVLDAIMVPAGEEPLVEVTIQNPFNEKDTLDDKMSVVDVKARDRAGKLYNIEMEMAAQGVYPQRALYYWAVLYGRQISEGDAYSKLQPTISISFVNNVLFPETPDHHLDFRLRSSRHPELVFSKHMSVHVVELPKFIRKPEELATPLDAWCYFLKHGATLDTDNLPEMLRTPPIRKAVEVMTVMKQNEAEWFRYQERLKVQRDQAMYVEALAEAVERAKRGRQEGLEQGREQGEWIGRIQVLQQLLNQPAAPRDELLAKSLPELQALAAALQQELTARGAK